MERLSEGELKKLSSHERYENKRYWHKIDVANLKKCLKKFDKEVLKPLGFVREGTRCAWNYDFG